MYLMRSGETRLFTLSQPREKISNCCVVVVVVVPLSHSMRHRLAATRRWRAMHTSNHSPDHALDVLHVLQHHAALACGLHTLNHTAPTMC